jgi:hypothetical protein
VKNEPTTSKNGQPSRKGRGLEVVDLQSETPSMKRHFLSGVPELLKLARVSQDSQASSGSTQQEERPPLNNLDLELHDHLQARITELEHALAEEKRLTDQQQKQMTIFEDQVLRRYKDMHREQEKSRQNMSALEHKVSKYRLKHTNSQKEGHFSDYQGILLVGRVQNNFCLTGSRERAEGMGRVS